MSLASLSGIDVLSGTISVPYSGPWHADLVLAQPTDISGPQAILFAGSTWVCSYIRDIVFAGRRGVRLVAGQGGWRTTIPGKQYGQGIIATATVLADAAAASGEPTPVVAVTAPQIVGNAFCRGAGPASAVLQQVLGDAWWIDTSGIVQTGIRLSTPILSAFNALAVDGAAGRYVIGTDAPNDWQPGCTFAGPTVSGTVSRVVHVLSPDALRTEVMVL